MPQLASLPLVAAVIYVAKYGEEVWHKARIQDSGFATRCGDWFDLTECDHMNESPLPTEVCPYCNKPV